MVIKMKFKINESLEFPYEGFFWIIDDKVVGYSEQVPKYGYEYKQSKTHANSWDYMKPVNCDKPFDYYSRGRVMVDPEYDKEGNFKYFTAMVFLDPCINNDYYKSIISDYYNLDIPTMYNINWMGNLKGRAGIDHYTCYKCR